MSDESIELGRKISEVRERKGISLNMLAVAAGLSLHQIRRIERGIAVPNAIALAKIAKELDLDLNELFLHVISERELIDKLWNKHGMKGRITGSNPANYRQKKSLLKALGFWHD
jgi:transcriptional regulator with XRE-family HTH domain